MYWRPLPGEDRGARVVALVEAALAGGGGRSWSRRRWRPGRRWGTRSARPFPTPPTWPATCPTGAATGPGRSCAGAGAWSWSAAAPACSPRCRRWAAWSWTTRPTSPTRSSAPRFHAREVALRRAATGRALCVLTGTVPSAEALAAMQAGQCRLLTPDRAAERAARPLVEVVDPDDEGPTAARLHPRALAAVRAALGRDEPAYVLVPRRGGADPAAPGARTAGQVAAELARILPGVPVWRLDRGGRPGHGAPLGRAAAGRGRRHRRRGQGPPAADRLPHRGRGRRRHRPRPGRDPVGRGGLPDLEPGRRLVRAPERRRPPGPPDPPRRPPRRPGPGPLGPRVLLAPRAPAPGRARLPPARRLVLVEGPEPGEATAAMAALAAALGPKVELLGPAAMGRGWRIIAKVEDAESAARALRPCSPRRPAPAAHACRWTSSPSRSWPPPAVIRRRGEPAPWHCSRSGCTATRS